MSLRVVYSRLVFGEVTGTLALLSLLLSSLIRTRLQANQFAGYYYYDVSLLCVFCCLILRVKHYDASFSLSII